MAGGTVQKSYNQEFLSDGASQHVKKKCAELTVKLLQVCFSTALTYGNSCYCC